MTSLSGAATAGPLLVTVTSAGSCGPGFATMTRYSLALFEAFVSEGELTFAVLITPKSPAGSGRIWRTTTNVAVLSTAIVGAVHEISPVVAPGEGVEQLKPAAGVTETKLHALLIVSVIVTASEEVGPKLVTVMVKAMSLSGAANPVVAVLSMARSLSRRTDVAAELELFPGLGSLGEFTVTVLVSGVPVGASSGT